MGQLPKSTLQLLAVFAVVAAAALVFVYVQQCSGGGGQFQEIGQEMQGRLQEGTIPASYDYVADYQTKQYWPNEAKYVNAIPEQRRVYILDKETLTEFKGYEAGPL